MTPVLAFLLSGVLMNRESRGVWKLGSIAASETAGPFALCHLQPDSQIEWRHRDIIEAEAL